MHTLFTLRRAALAIAVAAALAGPAAAQQPLAAAPATSCLLLPLDPAERAQRATLVVEAEVVAQRSFWDREHRHIYTANTLRVYKLLKGQWAAGQPLTVITEGGTVELARESITNTLALKVGEQGLLFLQPAGFRGVSEPQAFMPYGSLQGFIRYDVAAATAAEPFRRYPLLDEDFYRQQLTFTGQELRLLDANPALTAAVARRLRPATAQRVTAPVITTLAPLSVTAGTGTVLTISGSGFGATPGSVDFRNADDGGASFTRTPSSEIVSWSDTRIQVRVPSFTEQGRPAGTGNIRVNTADNQSTISALSITVVYAVSNVQETTSLALFPTEHFNQNRRGGYSFQPDAGFAQNAAAMQAFGRALASWRCQTAINWELGATRTSRGIASDDVNALEFDQGSELPAQVLGRTTSYFLGCRDANGQIRFWVKEIDMLYDDGTPWQFGPSLPTALQIDFESVAVHELGHGHQLSHIIAPAAAGRPGAVMHYAIGRGQLNRTLDFDRDIQGGYIVLQRSFAPDKCGAAPMIPAPLTGTLSAQTAGPRVLLTWPVRDECNVRNYVVERSTDNQQTWARAGQVSPTGAASYTFTDNNPGAELVHYRVLVQLSNGLSLTVAPVSVRTIPGPEFALYPNPRRGSEVYVALNAASTDNLIIRLYDAVGRYYGGTAYPVPQAGFNPQIQVELPVLRAGWYLIRWEAGSQKGTVPFIQVE
ncbi:IPT/TIG domain-containing protein [Hymenobacter latericus]|uniref:IPT/TIG domain-containing protein n=1 Tax=Hymenobacter sp. YIM 151858-1 TaxID=2987688 RepID=UPI002227D9E5|nr:IPT/TIG domain-containing protein [Hymenobacter sp. YIM 151858-1]UYZ58581.1 IPT/TIG domain-containing protein [Hymenobacter sp. YIM 151858-1]